MCVPKYTVQTADWSLHVDQNYIDDDWSQWRVYQKQIEYYSMMYCPYTKSLWSKINSQKKTYGKPKMQVITEVWERQDHMPP